MRELCRLVGACLVAAGCSGGGDAACATAVPMQTVQSAVLDGCSTSNNGCHAMTPFAASLNLTAGHAYAALVHAPSTSSPGQWRVEPGDLEGSFLWHKLTAELATDGSDGVAMPRSASDQWAPLTAAQLATVRCWIASGAPAD